MPLTTAAQVFTLLGIEDDGPAGVNDTFIDEAIAHLDVAVPRFCGRTLEQASLDEYYDGCDSAALVLRSAPVASVTSVSIVDLSGGETVLGASEYRVVTDTGLLLRAGGGGYTDGDWSTVWPDGIGNIRVQYTGGYATVPADLAYVVARIAADMLLDRRNNRRMAGENPGSAGYTRRSVDEIMRQYTADLKPWMRGGV